MLDDDCMWSIVVSCQCLDHVISISLTSNHMNDMLTYRINDVAKLFGIVRPTISWSDLVRENSKIHATQYAKLQSSTFYDTIPDLASGDILLSNAIREEQYQLVDKYFNYFTPKHFNQCRSGEMIWYILSLIPNNNVMVDVDCTVDGKFNIDLFALWVNDILPNTKNMFTFNSAISHAVDADYPIDTLPLCSIDGNKLLINNMKYHIPLWKAGRHNLHLIDVDMLYDLESNSNTQLIVDLFRNLGYRPTSYCSHIQNHGGGDHIIRYMVEELGYVFSDNMLQSYATHNHRAAIRYLKNIYPRILQYIVLDTYITLESIDFIVEVAGVDRLTEMLNHAHQPMGDIVGGTDDSLTLIKYVIEVLGIRLDNYDYMVASAMYHDNMRCAAYLMSLGGISIDDIGKYKFDMDAQQKQRIIERLRYYQRN